MWTQKHVFPNLDRDEVYEGQIEVTLWNFSHTVKHECIGEYRRKLSGEALLHADRGYIHRRKGAAIRFSVAAAAMQ